VCPYDCFFDAFQAFLVLIQKATRYDDMQFAGRLQASCWRKRPSYCYRAVEENLKRIYFS